MVSAERYDEKMKASLFLKNLRWWGVVILVCGSVCWQVLARLPDGLTRVFFLDVGQGDSMLLKLPHGGHVLIDGGPGSNIVEPLRKAMGWLGGEIDLVVVTHFDRDHCEGLLRVFEDYRVGHVLITGVEQGTDLQKQLFSLIAKKHIPVWIADSQTDFLLDSGGVGGGTGSGGAVVMDVLSPFETLAGKYYKNANETSIVARILVVDSDKGEEPESAQPKILMTGDIGEEAEKSLVERYGASGELRAEVLKVAHHGSRYSSTEDFLRKVSPKTAVISVSARNTYHHPHPDALGRLGKFLSTANILRTDKKGTVEMSF